MHDGKDEFLQCGLKNNEHILVCRNPCSVYNQGIRLIPVSGQHGLCLVCRMSHLVQIDSMSSSSLVCCLVSSWDGGLSWLDLLHWKDVTNGSLSTKSRATFSFEPHELHRKQYYISCVEPQMRYIEMKADFNLRTPLSHWKITMMMRTVKYSHYSRTPIHS